jgi:hypothetical protein
VLDQNLLDELESRWRRQGAAIVERLRPGLTKTEMDVVTEPLGIRLPREARRWWGWHDGATDERPFSGYQLGPGRNFQSLEESVAFTMETWEITGSSKRIPGWLQLTSGPPSLTIDCAVPEAAPVPVYAVEWEDWPTSPSLASLGDLVQTWIAALDEGFWRWNAETGQWERGRLDGFDSELEVTGAV